MVTYFVYRGHRKCRTRRNHAVFFCEEQQPHIELRSPNVEVSKSQIHTRQDTSERVISSPQRLISTHYTKNTRDKHPHLKRGRNGDPSNRAASDLRSRPHGQWDRSYAVLRSRVYQAVNYIFKTETTYFVYACSLRYGSILCRK